jgi:altronate hydrolase
VRKTVQAGVDAVREALPRLNAMQRTTQPASKLVLGCECGGSDGSSGITANPAVGNAADRLVRQGGTAVLAETPEICGAEHLLIERAVSDAVADKVIGFVDWWEAYAAKWGFTLQQNLAAGNYEGGLTTIAEKSLGAVAKGGTTPLTGAFGFAEPIDTPGFVFMDTPGYDPVSVTGMVAGGCNLIIFTTGRGSVFGCKPSPSLKICTNTVTYERMIEDMDINAGTILTGESVASVGERIFEELLAVASGKPTKSEAQGIGDEEFAPWDYGPFF